MDMHVNMVTKNSNLNTFKVSSKSFTNLVFSTRALLLLFSASTCIYGLIVVMNVHVFKDTSSMKRCDYSRDRKPCFLFIAIGTAPENFAYRREWRLLLRDHAIVNHDVTFYFYTEMTEDISRENAEHGDIIGYNETQIERFQLGSTFSRGLFQLNSSRSMHTYEYFLHVDDDGVLCIHKLLHQLRALPNGVEKFFWGRYWCDLGMSRADENFLLLSNSLVENVLTMSTILQLNEKRTFAINLGYLLGIMKNVQIFDDQIQIDSQQGYLTEFMSKAYDSSRDNDYKSFCRKFLWGHRVKDTSVMHAGVMGALESIHPDEVPVVTSPEQTCSFRYSFDPSIILQSKFFCLASHRFGICHKN